MKFNHDTSWDNFETVFNSRLPIREAWNKIIDFHEQTIPKPYWASLRQLDIENEQKEITEWLEQFAQNSPLPKSVVALWLGIAKILNDEEEEIYVIYLTGSDTYDAEDLDWAAEPIYEPENKYGVSGVLNEMDEIIKCDETDYSFLDWILPLAYCALTVDEVIRTNLNKKLFLKSKPKLFFTTGHDSGDFKNLTTIE